MPKILSRCGIYCIKCTQNNNIYIGSSLNISSREKSHFWRLKKGCHESKLLQSEWTKYGATAFTFEVIEICDLDVLRDREQHYLDTLKPFPPYGYNTAHSARSPMLGLSKTPEHRAKLSAALKGRERKNPSKGKIYLLKSPTGTTIQVYNLLKFCRETELDYNALYLVAIGKREYHEGWTCPNYIGGQSIISRGKLPKGVQRCGKKYKASIMRNGQVYPLGKFATAEDAHAAYIEAAKKYHGEFAKWE